MHHKSKFKFWIWKAKICTGNPHTQTSSSLTLTTPWSTNWVIQTVNHRAQGIRTRSEWKVKEKCHIRQGTVESIKCKYEINENKVKNNPKNLHSSVSLICFLKGLKFQCYIKGGWRVVWIGFWSYAPPHTSNSFASRELFQARERHIHLTSRNCNVRLLMLRLLSRPMLSVGSLTLIRWYPARVTIGSCLRPSPRWLVECRALCTWPLQWASAHWMKLRFHVGYISPLFHLKPVLGCGLWSCANFFIRIKRFLHKTSLSEFCTFTAFKPQ